MIRLIKGDARSSAYRSYDHSRVFVTVVKGTKNQLGIVKSGRAPRLTGIFSAW